ncbi:hypothetical protein HN873_028852 [Arachis hypogaea]
MEVMMAATMTNGKGFLSIFGVFGGSKKSSKGPKGGYYYDPYDSGHKVWPSDYDEDCWGPGKPDIDERARAFILKCRNRVTQSECHQLDPADAAPRA